MSKKTTITGWAIEFYEFLFDVGVKACDGAADLFVTGTNSFFQFLEGGLDYIFGKIESVGEASRHSTNFKITRMFSDSDAEAASRMNPDNWLIPSDVRAQYKSGYSEGVERES